MNDNDLKQHIKKELGFKNMPEMFQSIGYDNLLYNKLQTDELKECKLNNIVLTHYNINTIDLIVMIKEYQKIKISLDNLKM